MSTPITRKETNEKMSEVVAHEGRVYLAGQVAADSSKDITSQTQQVLAQIDARLGSAGSDKTRVLQALIILKDLKDFAAMNEVWKQWIGPTHGPARATFEGNLVDPKARVEIVITAATKTAKL